MKKITLLLLTVFFFGKTYAQDNLLDNLLSKHVSAKGVVDYKSFKTDETKLNEYLTYLENLSFSDDWSAEKQKALWVNAYNAYTIKVILDNYPVASIMDIKEGDKGAWDLSIAKIAGKTYSLNHIEHEILRKQFDDPKIHVAVNCASISCPKLANFAFTEENYEEKTDELMRAFINDSSKNIITESKVQLSKIFEWFAADFTKKGSLFEFINKYSELKIGKKAKVKYLNYNWNLNGK